MGRPFDGARPGGFGLVRVDHEGPEYTSPSGEKLRRSQYTWWPDEGLSDQLPGEFHLCLQCLTGPDGMRCFFPWADFGDFLAVASAGGLSILAQRQHLTGNERYSYRAMRLLFLRVHRMAEHFRHGFNSSRDLTISASGRSHRAETDILPDDVGLDAQGRGRRWSVRELIERGDKAAGNAGFVRPRMAVRIHYGLLEAARRNPLPLAEEDVPRLIRSALFSWNPSEQPPLDLVECVTERLLTAVYPHLDDDKRTFDKWFLGPKNSLVHQLAKQKRSPGGEIPEDDVRRALLELGWQAYQYAANCVHAQMRTFQNALLEPLAGREQLLFEHMHLRQPYLGNFPLVLLGPRLGLVKGLLWQLWEQAPDLTLAPVVYRLLDFYSTMASRRRAADRRIKRPRSVRLSEISHASPGKGPAFQDIAAAVRELEKIDCECPRRDWWAELKGKPGAKIRILHRCMACNFKKESILGRDKFTQIGRETL